MFSSKSDLLNSMLSGIDRKTGERLDDVNIRYQIITFLIAGHETTSGLLSFAINALINHPEVLARAYEEVDRVLGPDPSSQPSLRASQSAQLHHPNPQGNAAAMADRAGLLRLFLRRDGNWWQVS